VVKVKTTFERGRSKIMKLREFERRKFFVRFYWFVQEFLLDI